MTQIANNNFSDHVSIAKLISEGLELIVSINKNVRYLSGEDEYDRDVLRLFKFQAQFINTCAGLAELNCYAESLSLMRGILEHHLWLLLVSRGYLWKRKVTLKRKEGESERDAYDRILTKIEADIAANKIQNVKYLDKHKANKLALVLEGLFSEDSSIENPIPIYWFMAQNYNPMMAHVADLELISTWDPNLDDADGRKWIQYHNSPWQKCSAI
ncbi:MAG: hypothetical protein ACKVS6_05125 [Planctomycetota bacterium]